MSRQVVRHTLPHEHGADVGTITGVEQAAIEALTFEIAGHMAHALCPCFESGEDRDLSALRVLLIHFEHIDGSHASKSIRPRVEPGAEEDDLADAVSDGSTHGIVDSARARDCRRARAWSSHPVVQTGSDPTHHR